MSPEVEQEFQQLWERGLPVAKIAKMLGYSRDYLYTYVKDRRDRFPRRYKQFSKDTRAKMGEIVRDGSVSAERVANVLGVCVETVRKWAREQE